MPSRDSRRCSYRPVPRRQKRARTAADARRGRRELAKLHIEKETPAERTNETPGGVNEVGRRRGGRRGMDQKNGAGARKRAGSLAVDHRKWRRRKFREAADAASVLHATVGGSRKKDDVAKRVKTPG